jgi:hypothetical protein
MYVWAIKSPITRLFLRETTAVPPYENLELFDFVILSAF